VIARRMGEAKPSPHGMAVAQYRSGVCCCGLTKIPGRSFCGVCWRALPAKLRRPLVGTFGEEYELAYFAAAKWLSERLPQQEKAS
jgi:hypothetical protein